MNLKPFYSIQELAEILDTGIPLVADGLVAYGIPAFFMGKEIVLAEYGCFRHPNQNVRNIYVFTGEQPASPKPGNVVVSTEKLPRLWTERIENVESTIGEQSEEPPAATDRTYVSDNLAILNQAAAKFWANASRDDRTTHPSKTNVVAWLLERGFSQKLADSGATIVRPEWAPTGRKAEE